MSIDKFKRLWKFLFIPPRTASHIREIKRSGLFDRSFFLKTYPDLHPLFKSHPERFYVVFGEALGFQPCADFFPAAYLHYNPDLADWEKHPFLHFIRHGHKESRVSQKAPSSPDTEELILPPACTPRPPTAETAIVIHVYYPDLWDELETVLAALDFPFDLFVTLSSKATAETDLHQRIIKRFPQAQLFDMPNHGRDIFPFVYLINGGHLDDYTAVCKLHTKKSLHLSDGHVWRQKLIAGLLHGPETTQSLQQFLNATDTALWVSDAQLYTGARWWGPNFSNTCRLLERAEIIPDYDALRFPAGSMFWVKPIVLEMLKALHLRAEDFEVEQGQVDGTTAHCFERALGFLARAAGQDIQETSSLRAHQPPPTTVAPRFVSALYHGGYSNAVPSSPTASASKWMAVSSVEPVFSGHQQPYLPGTLGYYDQTDPNALRRQADLAEQAGIDAFCLRLHGSLSDNRPLETVFKTPDLSFPFYLCWENTLPLDAGAFEEQLAAVTARAMADPRYQRPVANRPRFLIGYPQNLSDAPASIATLRRMWRDAGIDNVELGGFIPGPQAALSDGPFDFWIDDPTRYMVFPSDDQATLPDRLPRRFAAFQGTIGPFSALPAAQARQAGPKVIPSVSPAWDTLARDGQSANIAYGGGPAAFYKWLNHAICEQAPCSYNQEIFINAWNGWDNKTAIEPSQLYNTSYLRILARLTGKC